MIEKYIINENTLAIYVEKEVTIIVENYVEYKTTKTPTEIIENSCNYYGSSISGRIKATEYMIGVRYKCPIIISEIKNLIWFPTMSYKYNICSWFNINGIKKYSKNIKKDLINIELTNEKTIELDVSANIISNQIYKSSRLESVFKAKFNK